MTVLISLDRFMRFPEMQPAVNWLRRELARLDGLNRKEAKNAVVRQRQGASQVLDDLLRLSDGADKQAEQIRATLLKRKGVQT
jgi:hypothetical protein